MAIYTTVHGDMWDHIAKKVYGDEKYIKELMEANTAHLSTLVFSAGVILNIPGISTQPSASTLPPWRR